MAFSLRTTQLSNGRRAPGYGQCIFTFSVEMYHGGYITWGNSELRYNRGMISYFDDCNPENMSYIGLIEMAGMVGVESATIKKMYYREHGNAIGEIRCDKDAIDLGKHVDEERVVQVYIETYVVPEMNFSDDSSDPDYVAADDSDGSSADESLERFGGSDEEVGIEDDIAGVVRPGNGENPRNVSTIVDYGNEEDVLNEGYADSDSLESVDSDSEGGGTARTFARVDMNNVKFKVGMKFESKDHFRDAVKRYSIKEGKGVNFERSSAAKVSVICVPGCQWKCFATRLRDDVTFHISSLYDVHTCSRTMENKQCTSRYIAEFFLSRIRNNMKWGLNKFRAEVQSVMKCKITKNKANKALRLARKMIVGSNADQFALLWDYIDEIKRSNPGTTAVMRTKERAGPNGEPVFKSIYICWNALKKGFLEGCRPVIGLDGCHLTGPSKGVLLAAVAIDANNCMYPFAYGVVDIENTKRWVWFLEQLMQDIKVTSNYTFISDKQKGLIKAIEKVMPFVEHRFCVRHLYNNFKIKHRGLLLKDLLWKAARATTLPHFQAALDEMKAADKEAYEWLREKPELVVNEPVVNEAVVGEPIVGEAVSEPIVSEPMVSEPVLSEPMVTDHYDDDFWRDIDELVQSNSQPSPGEQVQVQKKMKTKAKLGVNIKPRRSSRIMNRPNKGPKETAHVDLTSDDNEDVGSVSNIESQAEHGGVFKDQAPTQESQTLPASGDRLLHAGIVKPLSPMPSGQFKRNNKVYLTKEGLKKLRQDDINKHKLGFLPPRVKKP